MPAFRDGQGLATLTERVGNKPIHAKRSEHTEREKSQHPEERRDFAARREPSTRLPARKGSVSSPEFPRISFSYLKTNKNHKKQTKKKKKTEDGESKQTTTKQKKKKKEEKKPKPFIFFLGNLLIFRSFLAGFSCRFGFHFSEQRGETRRRRQRRSRRGGNGSGKAQRGGRRRRQRRPCSAPRPLRVRSETAPLRPRQQRPAGPAPAPAAEPRSVPPAPLSGDMEPTRQGGREHTHHTHTFSTVFWVPTTRETLKRADPRSRCYLLFTVYIYMIDMRYRYIYI